MKTNFHPQVDPADVEAALGLIDDICDPRELSRAVRHLGFRRRSPLHQRLEMFSAFADRLYDTKMPVHALAYAVAICPLPVLRQVGPDGPTVRGRFEEENFRSLVRTGALAPIELKASRSIVQMLAMTPLPRDISLEAFAREYGAEIRDGKVISVQTTELCEVHLWRLVGDARGVA
jgi:hypothetical protein